MTQDELETELQAILSLEIAREFLLADGITLDDEEIQKLLDVSNGNPVDVPTLHRMLKMKEVS